MTKRNVEAYAAAQQPLCVQNDTIPESLFQEYGVNRGLRDANGVGVLTGLTNISKIVSFQNVGGKRMPRGAAVVPGVQHQGPHRRPGAPGVRL